MFQGLAQTLCARPRCPCFRGTTTPALVILIALQGVSGSFAAVQSQGGPEITRFSVAEPLGISRTAQPMTGGIPLAKSAVRCLDELCVLDGSGRAVPAQFGELSRWREDGSLKWVLVDLQSDMTPSESREFRLAKGDNPAPRRRVSVSESERYIRVDTGPLRFMVRRTKFNFLRKAWLKEGDDERLVVDAGSEGGVRVIDWGKTEFWSHADTECVVEVEEAGPLRAVVHAKGRHVDAEGNAFCRWVVRIHAFAGRSDRKVFHTFVFDGDPEKDLIRDVSLHLPLNFAEEKKTGRRLDEIAGLGVEGEQ